MSPGPEWERVERPPLELLASLGGALLIRTRRRHGGGRTGAARAPRGW